MGKLHPCFIEAQCFKQGTVSPESMTQSEPSSTALATSVASALVGRGFFTMDSSICVAVITGFPACIQQQHPFCHRAFARCVQTYLADIGDVRALAHKGRCNEVNVIGNSPLDQILLIFLCQVTGDMLALSAINFATDPQNERQ
ncbi:MAG: hypothetical protein FRX49_00984 [Trebouxia sp. A1-2]|nr:MAG: hypothetical protein FRX49_00984 [Trebouxia sp. A1-2]